MSQPVDGHASLVDEIAVRAAGRVVIQDTSLPCVLPLALSKPVATPLGGGGYSLATLWCGIVGSEEDLTVIGGGPAQALATNAPHVATIFQGPTSIHVLGADACPPLSWPFYPPDPVMHSDPPGPPLWTWWWQKWPNGRITALYEHVIRLSSPAPAHVTVDCADLSLLAPADSGTCACPCESEQADLPLQPAASPVTLEVHHIPTTPPPRNATAAK